MNFMPTTKIMKWTVQLSKESILINLSYVFYSEKRRLKIKDNQLWWRQRNILPHIVTLKYSFILTLSQTHEDLLAPKILFHFTEYIIYYNVQQVNKDKITNQHIWYVIYWTYMSFQSWLTLNFFCFWFNHFINDH